MATEPVQVAYARTPVSTKVCPICGRVAQRWPWIKRLYDVPVCPKCRNSFANRRQIAYVIDCLAPAVILFGVAHVFGEIARLVGVSAAPVQPTTAATPTTVTFSVVDILFHWVLFPLVFSLKNGFGGYSPGKWLMGVRVVDSFSRQPIGFRQSFLRNIILAVPMIPIVVAFQLVSGQRLGDSWANTEVIWVKKKHTPPFERNDLVCHRCGYDLTGNVSGNCPECGRAVPPAP